MPCSETGCGEPIRCKGLCTLHYGRAYRAGTLSQYRSADTKHHRLSDLDTATETAYCSACVERVPLGVSTRKNQWRCANSPDLQGNGKGAREGETLGYGITVAQRRSLIRKHGECWICGVADGLVIDHCHETGKIRGVLCGGCNSGLGMFKDDQIRLRRAIKYLDDPPINKPPKRVALAC